MTVGGIINTLTKKFTKRGQQMAFITLEDLVGTVEVIVFPRQFEQYRTLMEEGQIIFVSGEAQIEENNDGKIIANNISSFGDMPSKIWVSFKNKDEYFEKEKEFENLLWNNHGNDIVMVYLAEEKQVKQMDSKYNVNGSSEFIAKLKEIYGEENVK